MPCVSGRPWQLRSSVWTRTAYGVGLWLRLSVDQSLATSTMHQQKHFLGRYTCGRARGRSRFREGGARAPSSPMRSRDMLRLAGLALTVSSSSGLAATALSPQLRGTASRAASMPFLRVAAAGPRMDEAPTLEEEVRTCSQPRGSVHARAVGSLCARVGIMPALTPFFAAPPRAPTASAAHGRTHHARGVRRAVDCDDRGGVPGGARFGHLG